jgi:hypothetical protein
MLATNDSLLWSDHQSTDSNVACRGGLMNLASQYCQFFDDDEFVETDRPGFRRRVITGDNLQLCFWRIKGGVSGSFMHKHDDHEQLGVIVRGALDFRISTDKEIEQRELIEAHQAYLAPRGVWHGDSVFVGDDEFDECWILDVFSPPREDLVGG